MTDKTKPTPAMKSKKEILTEYHLPPNSLDIGIRDGEPGLILDRILWAMESYATQQTAELQQEVDRLREALREITNIYEVTYPYHKKSSRIYQIAKKDWKLNI